MYTNCLPLFCILEPMVEQGFSGPPVLQPGWLLCGPQLLQAAQLVSTVIPAFWSFCFVSELLLLGCFSAQGIHFTFPWFISLLAFYANRTSLALGRYSPRHPQVWCPHRPTNQGLFPGLPPE